jgi:CubicO group peptidase (beta-lactamase class C family)
VRHCLWQVCKAGQHAYRARLNDKVVRAYRARVGDVGVILRFFFHSYSGIPEEVAAREDMGYIPASGTTYSIDYEERSVTATCLINNPLNQTYKSIYREHVGCTLVEVLSEAEIRAQQLGDVAPPAPLDPSVPWPRGEGFFPEQAPPEVDRACLARVAAEQFADRLANPRAILVVYRGQLVYEEYAPGITKDNRLLGWSATKSLTQSLVGIVAGEGRLDIFKPAPVPEWYETPNDPRQNITIDMMLRMSSGTRWTGDGAPTTECIFWSNNACAHVCALKPLVATPDTLWNYNSGSTYIMSRMVNDNRGDPQLTNWAWPKQRLFYPIGAHSMYIEVQPNSHFLGGAYGYGKPRDWARFGLLHQRGGVWIDGTRILPEGWTTYSSTPSPTNANYAGHFWRVPEVDERLYYASGFRNQNVFVFPAQELVVVRMSMPPLLYFGWDKVPFLQGVLSCIRPANTTTV